MILFLLDINLFPLLIFDISKCITDIPTDQVSYGVDAHCHWAVESLQKN